MLDKNKILVCFLLFSALYVNASAQNKKTENRLSNIEVFGKFWGNVFLFHPMIICDENDQRWYQIIDSEFSKIENSPNSKVLCSNLNDIIDKSSFANGTRVIYTNKKIEPISDSMYCIKNSNNKKAFVYINLKNPDLYYSNEFFDLFSEMQRMPDSVIFVLDMRWNNIIEKDEEDITKFYPLRFFVNSELTRPKYFSRHYYGWNETNYYNVFNQASSITDKEPLLPINKPEIWLKRWHRQVNFDSLKIFRNKVIFIVNDNTLSYCKGYLDQMQNYANVSVAYDPSTIRFTMDHDRQIQLNDSLILNLCTEELISSKGNAGFKPDFSIDGEANIESLILQASHFLNKGKDRSVVSNVNFDFDISHGYSLDSLPMSKNSYFLFFFKTWSVINYFDPHLELAEIHWNTQFKRGIRSIDTCKSDKAFFEAILILTKPLNDGHIKISNAYKFMPEGEYSVPLKLRKFNDSYLVIESWDSKVCSGDRILKIDGETITEVEKRIAAKKSFSTVAATNQWLDFYNQIIRRYKDNEKVKLEILTKEDKIIEVTLRATMKPWEAYSNDVTKPDKYLVADSILYFDLTKENSLKNLDSLIKNYANFKGLILDMRGFNYSFGPREDLLKRVTNVAIKSPIYKVPYVTFFDTLNNNFLQRQEMVMPDEKINTWKNKICILINNMPKSTPENFLMYLRDMENITFIGQPTCGTNGNVTQIEFPGDFALEFTGMEVLYPNGDNFQNIGIVPDILVEDDIQSLLSNSDKILNRAINYLLKRD